MSSGERLNYYNYFTEIEEHFVRRRGKHLLISPMDWGPFSRMSDQDLEALYLYLNSLEPVPRKDGLVMFKKE